MTLWCFYVISLLSIFLLPLRSLLPSVCKKASLSLSISVSLFLRLFFRCSTIPLFPYFGVAYPSFMIPLFFSKSFKNLSFYSFHHHSLPYVIWQPPRTHRPALTSLSSPHTVNLLISSPFLSHCLASCCTPIHSTRFSPHFSRSSFSFLSPLHYLHPFTRVRETRTGRKCVMKQRCRAHCPNWPAMNGVTDQLVLKRRRWRSMMGRAARLVEGDWWGCPTRLTDHTIRQSEHTDMFSPSVTQKPLNVRLLGNS